MGACVSKQIENEENGSCDEDKTELNEQQDNDFSAEVTYDRHPKVTTNAHTIAPNEDWRLRKFHSTLSHEKLGKMMDADPTNQSFLVIDVRDPSLDYLGGHISNSINIFHEEFVKKIEFLVEEYHSKTHIIIHCMYSQSRGPMCCGLYCTGLELLLKTYEKNKSDKEKLYEQYNANNGEFNALKKINLDETKYRNLMNQNVYLLKGGFRKWVNVHGDNEKYVSDFDMKHWNYEQVGGKTELYHNNDW